MWHQHASTLVSASVARQGNSHQPREMAWVSSLHTQRPTSTRPSRLPREPPQVDHAWKRAHTCPPTCPATHAQPVTFPGGSRRARLIHAATATELWALGSAGPRGGGSAVRPRWWWPWCHWVPADSLRGGKGGCSLVAAVRTVTSSA